MHKGCTRKEQCPGIFLINEAEQVAKSDVLSQQHMHQLENKACELEKFRTSSKACIKEATGNPVHMVLNTCEPFKSSSSQAIT